MSAPPDSFTREFNSLSAFWKYCSEPLSSEKRLTTKYATKADNEIAYQVDCWVSGLDRLGLDYFKPDRARGIVPAQSQIDALTMLMKEADGIPAPELVRLADSFFETCGGCGKGAEELEAVKPLLDTLWEQRVNYANRFDEPEDAVSTGILLSKVEIDHRLRGRSEQASDVADFVARLIREHVANPGNQRALNLAVKIRESLSPDSPLRKSLAERFSAEFGPESMEFFDALKCEACKAAANNDPNFEGLLDDLKSRLRRLDRREHEPEMAKKMDSQRGHIGIIELSRIEIKYRANSQMMDSKLREFGESNIVDILNVNRSPIRRSKVLFWLYCAGGRTSSGLLEEALLNLDLRPSVRSICILDVVSFREQIMQEFQRLQGASS
ncbi:MAG: hypothetical protein ABJ226_06570 [Roseobacter sp.]